MLGLVGGIAQECARRVVLTDSPLTDSEFDCCPIEYVLEVGLGRVAAPPSWFPYTRSSEPPAP